MATILQFELKHYIENHGFSALVQDSGLVVLIGAWNERGFLGNEAHYVETYRQAREVLGY